MIRQGAGYDESPTVTRGSFPGPKYGGSWLYYCAERVGLGFEDWRGTVAMIASDVTSCIESFCSAARRRLGWPRSPRADSSADGTAGAGARGCSPVRRSRRRVAERQGQAWERRAVGRRRRRCRRFRRKEGTTYVFAPKHWKRQNYTPEGWFRILSWFHVDGDDQLSAALELLAVAVAANPERRGARDQGGGSGSHDPRAPLVVSSGSWLGRARGGVHFDQALETNRPPTTTSASQDGSDAKPREHVWVSSCSTAAPATSSSALPDAGGPDVAAPTLARPMLGRSR